MYVGLDLERELIVVGSILIISVWLREKNGSLKSNFQGNMWFSQSGKDGQGRDGKWPMKGWKHRNPQGSPNGQKNGRVYLVDRIHK